MNSFVSHTNYRKENYLCSSYTFFQVWNAWHSEENKPLIKDAMRQFLAETLTPGEVAISSLFLVIVPDPLKRRQIRLQFLKWIIEKTKIGAALVSIRPSSKPYYGVYSAKQGSLYGEYEYRTKEGKIVTVTEISCKKGCPNNAWPDKVDIGEVVEFVRRIP